jgi:hypothetical protein
MKRDFYSRYRVLFTVLLCIGFFAAGYFVSPFARVMTRVPEEEAELEKEEAAGDAFAVQDAARTGAATRIFAVRTYLKSNSVQIAEIPIQPSQLGLDELEFSVTVGEWKILEFAADRIFISKDVTGYGPGSYTLSISKHDGREKLALYAYDDEGYRYLKDAYETPLENFPEEEKKKLREGITVIGEESLYKLLENYAE